MEREHRGYCNLMVVSLLVALGLSFFAGRLQAAGLLPPEAKDLTRHFYKKHNICDNVEAYVQYQVKLWWEKDNSVTPKLLKLLYADCMVNGCDGSILLDGPDTEKTAAQNVGLGLDVFVLIDKIKKVVDIRCKAPVVSCADILNLAARDAVHLAGAPSYPVFLGRRDGVESKAAWVDFPMSSASWDDGLAYFTSKGLNLQDYATILGSKTMGQTPCASIQKHLDTSKSDPTLNPSTLDKLRGLCTSSMSTTDVNSTAGGGYQFNNAYYTNVQSYQSLVGVDQQSLFNYNMTQFVLEYASSMEQFKKGFALSISRMGGLKVLTGNRGEVRRNCRFTNE